MPLFARRRLHAAAPYLTIASFAASFIPMACGPAFEGCEERRTCPVEAEGGAGGDANVPGPRGGAPSGGRGGSPSVHGEGGAGARPEGGADNGSSEDLPDGTAAVGAGGASGSGGSPAGTAGTFPVPSDAGAAGGGGDVPSCAPTAKPPRLLAPLSTALVTSRRPTLEFEVGDDCGPLVLEVCADRDCTKVRSTVPVEAGAVSGRPNTDLPVGVSFWRVRSGDRASHVWQFTAGKDTPVDTWWGTIPDFNGDGFSDVAVGTLSDVVYVYYGSPDGLDAESPTILEKPEKDELLFGAQLASAGDVNGDGFADLVVASAALPAGGEGSRVYVYSGGPGGLAPKPSKIVESASYRHVGFDPNGVGSALRGGADVNSDGFADFVLTAPRENGSGGFTPYFGRPDDVLIGREVGGSNSWFGSSLAFCDVNADRRTDMIIGAPVVPDDVVDSDDLKEKQATVYRGTGVDLQARQELVLTLGFGYRVACFDATGDGYPELVTSSPMYTGIGYYAGDIRVFENSSGTLAEIGTSLPEQPSFNYSLSGRLVAPIGDMDDDGTVDIVVNDVSEARIVFLATGDSADDVVRVIGRWEGAPQDFTGGDTNGDSLADLVLTEMDYGITVYLGSKRSRVVSPSQSYIPAPAGVTGFGRTLSAGL